MAFFIVGLGNPGEEYENTRHNAGRMALLALALREKFPDWQFYKKIGAQMTKGTLGSMPVTLVLPETYMNNSGKVLGKLISSPKVVKRNLVVVYDDLDLPLGSLKMSFGRSSGGHRGLESIIKNLKTKDFARIRIGISPGTIKKLKKPQGETLVHGFLLKPFSASELKTLKSVFDILQEGLGMVVGDGYERAMGFLNSKPH